MHEHEKLVKAKHATQVVKADAKKADHEAENDAEKAHKKVLHAKTEL